MGIVRNQSIKNSISFYIGMSIGAVNTILIYPNVFKDNPEHFGLIQVLVAYAIVISTFTTVGVPTTFMRFFPSIKEKGQLFFLSLIVPFIGFTLASLSYFLFKDQVFEFLNASDLLKENFFYIILLVFFIGFYDVLSAISRSYLSAATPIFINEVFLKFYSMSTLLFHWFGYIDFTAFLQIYLFGYVLKFTILFILQFREDRLIFNFSLKDLDLKELLKFGFYVLVGGASIMIVTRLDMMMIASLLDLEQVAFYTVAFFIGNAIKIPGKSIVTISTPLVAKAWENQDLNEIQTLYAKSSINQLIIGGILFVCIWLNIDEIFSLLPEKFQGGRWVVFYIGLSQLFSITAGINGIIIVNSKYYKYDLYTNVILVFITIATNYILIPIHGINGAAIATAISLLLFNLFRLIFIKVKMDMQPFSKETVFTILVLLAVYLMFNNMNLALLPLFAIVVKSSLALLIYIILVIKLKLSEDISGFVNDLKSRFIKVD
jgi:O-antigen/teichoic acid export membrane protein